MTRNVVTVGWKVCPICKEVQDVVYLREIGPRELWDKCSLSQHSRSSFFGLKRKPCEGSSEPVSNFQVSISFP